MQFQRQPLNEEAVKALSQWFLQPQRDTLKRCVTAMIAELQVQALDLAVQSEATAFNGVLNPQLDSKQRTLLSKAARLSLFLEVQDELMAKTQDLFIGSVTL